MKAFKNSVILFCLVLLVFSSCKNDLKLNAPYKEIPSVFAVLNPDEAVQIIRVNKVFLGETDANQMAKVADSINYQPNEITVSLMHSSNPTLTVFSESVITTDAGKFNTTQRVYISPPGFTLETSGTYTLTVKNNHTENVFTSTATAISRIRTDGQIFVLFNAPFYPAPPTTDPSSPHYIDYSVLNPKYPYIFRFYPNEAAVYKITLRMHFYDTLDNGQKTYGSADFSSGNIEKRDKKEITMSFRGADVFNAAGIELAKQGLTKDLYGRKMYKMEYIINSSTQEYVDYMQFASPSLSINQNKPLFSNFKDNKALGIFTFRTTFSMSKSLNSVFVSAFASNPNTCYKFMQANGTVGCFKP